MSGLPLSLFEGYGIEIELMLCDALTYDVRPVVDRVLRERAPGGEWVGDVDDGPVGWSNELVLHQLELKTNGPAPSLERAAEDLHASVARLAPLAERHGAVLVPGGAHPWMDPTVDTRLWPHEYAEVYATYDALFDCHRHGWANVQATHLNLPFAGDDELGRLLAAVRVALPLLPALAAASPYLEGAHAGALDGRLRACRTNSVRVPQMAGDVIPEPVFDRAGYEREVLQPLYDALAPYDHDGVLRHEFANARGAIVRFDRDALEVRVLDVQEHPGADLAVCAATVALVRALVDERWSAGAAQRAVSTAALARLLRAVEVEGPDAIVEDPAVLATLGRRGAGARTVGALWRELADEGLFDRVAPTLARPLDVVLEHGPLARRMLQAAGAEPTRADLRALLRELAGCLARGEEFLP